MAFPSLRPTSRTFDPGDYPIKTYKAQNGSEVRVLYGSNRTNMKMSLSYANITDAEAEQFLDHYDEMKGTFTTFSISEQDLNTKAKTGWEGNPDAIGAESYNNAYRYDGPPQVQQVRPGISTVTVNLIGVL